MDNRIASHARMLEREEQYLADLKAAVPEPREAVLDIMKSLYRAGWRDCWEEMTNGND